MKLRAIRMRNIKKFGAQGLALEGLCDGLSVLAAPNEFGKSTIFEAVRLLLHEKHNTTKQAVKTFVPLSGGVGPEVELDIDVDGLSYRIRKRFLKSASAQVTDLTSGEVIASDGVADDWIANLIDAGKGGTGPTGLLWVAQGMSMAQPEGGEELLPSLLEAEVGTLVGGERARTYLDRTKVELAKMITKGGQAKAGGPYKTAKDVWQSLELLVSELAHNLAETEQVFGDLIDIDRQLEKLDDPDVAAKQIDALALARKTLKAASVASGEIRAAELTYSSYLRDLEEAARKLVERIQLEAQVLDASDLVDRLQPAINEREEHASKLKDKCYQAAEEEAAAEQTWKTARSQNVAYSKYERAKRASDARDEISNNLSRARKLADALSVLKAELSENATTEAVLIKLEDMSREQDVANAKLNAGRPSLVANLTDMGRAVVLLNEAPMGSDEVRLSGSSQIDIGDYGTIEIIASDPADLALASKAASEKLTSAMHAANVQNLTDARKQASVRRTIVSDIDALERQLEDLAPSGLSDLAQSLADANALIPDGFDEAADKPLAPVDLQEFEVRRDNAKVQLRALEGEYASAREGLIAEQAKLSSSQAKVDDLVSEIGKPDAWNEAKQVLQSVINTTRASAENAADELRKLQDAAPDLKSAELAVKRFEETKSNRESQLRSLRERRIELRTKLEAKEALGLGEQLSEAEAARIASERRVTEIETDVEALQLLHEALSCAQDTLKAEYFQPISAELEPLLRLVLGHSEVKLNDTYQANSLRRGTYAENVDTLSGGTREQVAVLTRLAFGRLMARRGKSIPVFLDDALVYCDDDRLAAMFNALHDAAADVQCIVLTCHERAFSEIGGQLLNAKPWISDA